MNEDWFSPEELKQLKPLIAQAKKEGWDFLLRTRSDYVALLEGCTFDINKALHAENFIQKYLLLPGKEPFVLLDWQRYDIIWPLFGWVRKNGRRRFRRAFVQIAKKNGKSMLASAILLYLLVGDGEPRPQVFAAAYNKTQAKIVLRECDRMVKESPLLADKLVSLASTNRIAYPRQFGFIQALSADSSGAEGVDASGVVIDELHLHVCRKLYDILRYSGRARKQPLMVIITTAGNNREGVCYEEYTYSKRIESGEHVDTSVLPVIYEAGADDSIDDPATWHKANPSLGTAFEVDDFKRDLEEAKTTPSKMSNFLQRSLNLWQDKNSLTGFIGRDKWDACRGEFPENLRDYPCFLGLDLGSTDDFTALAQVWKVDGRYYFKCFLWNPEDKIRERAREGRVPYREWTDAGWITESPGATVDFRLVDDKVRELMGEWNVQAIGYDGWGSLQLIQDWMEEGFPTVDVKQVLSVLAGPTKELERLILEKQLVHDGNPVLAWMVSNAVTRKDANGNLRLDKDKSADKIDGLAALIDALSRAMLAVEPEPYNGIGIAF